MTVLDSKRVTILKISGLCGIFSPIVGLSSVFLAIFYSPNFSWTKNWLSDLAGTYVSSLFPPRPDPSTAITANILNFGLIISGILALVLAFSLRISITLPSGRMGTLIMIFGSFALSGIGIFPEPTGSPHVVASLSFFASAPISMFYIGAAALDSKKKALGYTVFILGVIALIFGTVLLLFGAIPEIIAILSMSIFLMLLGFELFRRAPKPIFGSLR